MSEPSLPLFAAVREYVAVSSMTASEAAVLYSYAAHAQPDGTNSWPATDTVVRETKLDRRTVQRIRRKVIARGDLVPGENGPRGTVVYDIAPRIVNWRLPQRGGMVPPQGRHSDAGGGGMVPPKESFEESFKRKDGGGGMERNGQHDPADHHHQGTEDGEALRSAMSLVAEASADDNDSQEEAEWCGCPPADGYRLDAEGRMVCSDCGLQVDEDALHAARLEAAAA